MLKFPRDLEKMITKSRTTEKGFGDQFKICAQGEDEGVKKVVADWTRSAEYKTDRTIVSIPRTRVLVDTTFDFLWKPLHS